MQAEQYNLRSPAVKRLMKEASELRQATELFHAQPLDDNLFEWHFTVRGAAGTEFDGGIYHGRIILPTEYPMKPPSIMLLTANGRFELNKKICLSISGYHPESWQPSWSIRTALLAIIGFMPTPGAGAIGSLDYTPDERKTLAKKSCDYYCDMCRVRMRDVLPTLTESSKAATEEARELAQQFVMKGEDKAAASVSPSPDATSGDSLGDVPNIESSNINTTEFSSTIPNERTQAPEAADRGVSDLRQRAAQILAAANARRVTHAPEPIPDHRTDARQQSTTGGGNIHLFMIIVVSALIAVLVLRRLYIITEWRFH